jgi:hypothetical protein
VCGVVAAAPPLRFETSAGIGHNDNVERKSVEVDAGTKTSDTSGSPMQSGARFVLSWLSQHCFA